MMRKMTVVSLFALFYVALAPSAPTQSPEGEIGQILTHEGEVRVNDVPINKPYPKLRRGDKLRTVGSRSRVRVEIEAEPGETYRFDLRPDSRVKVENLLLLAELDGEIEVETRGAKPTINTARENISASGTHFLVTTRQPGTIVEVLAGQVEVKREGETMGTNIIRDYKALVPKGQALTVISPRPLYLQAGFSAAFPGTGRIYAGRNVKAAIATRVLSVGLFVGFVFYNGKREHASKESLEAHQDYQAAIQPGQIEAFYELHKDRAEAANRYRKVQIGFAVLYGVLAGYETFSTIRDGLANQKTIRAIKRFEEELRGPTVGLEIQGNAVLAKARWNFE